MEGIAGPVAVEYDADMVNDTSPISETRVDSPEELQHLRQHTPPLTYDVPSLPQNVEFSIAGTGCTVLQVIPQFTFSSFTFSFFYLSPSLSPFLLLLPPILIELSL